MMYGSLREWLIPGASLAGRVVGGHSFRSGVMVDLYFAGPTPLLDLPVSVFQDHRALFVAVDGENGYSWAQLCRNRINPMLVRYGLAANEMDDLFQIAFPPASYLDDSD